MSTQYEINFLKIIKMNLKNFIKIKKDFLNYPKSILVVVCKNRSNEEVKPLLNIGHKHFAENKVQEAEQKWVDLSQECYLHLIGNLQTNKIKQALKLFDYIHTVSSVKMAKIIKENLATAKTKNFFIQINIGNEINKSGLPLHKVDHQIEQIKEIIPITGLMCIPPQNDNPQAYFKKLQSIAIKHNLKNLSMGMSSDYKIALENGANFVRIGTAIFQKEEI